MPCDPQLVVKPIVRACGKTPAGLSTLLFMRKTYIPGESPLDLCAFPVSDLCDSEEWETAANECRVRAVNGLLGNKPETEFTLRRSPYLCGQETLASGQKKIEFKDFHYSLSGLDVDFWNSLMKSSIDFRFAYVNNIGEIYGFYDFTLLISQVYEDNNQKIRFFSGRILYSGWKLENPLLIPPAILSLLLSYQAYDCETEEDLEDYAPECE